MQTPTTHNKPIVLVLQAPPACGKTTYARQMVEGEASKTWCIISKDDIRHMLGVYWVESREDLVRKIEWESARLAVSKGYNIIIDVTNLREKDVRRWEGFCREFDCELQFKRWALPYSEAVARDQARNGKPGELAVGLAVMDYFYNTFFPELKDK